MRRLNTVTMSILSVGFALMGTSALTLPTDMGRSADVYANAVRYFATKLPELTTPRVRPEAFAELPVDDAADPAIVQDDVTVAAAPLDTSQDDAFAISTIPQDLAGLDILRGTEENAFSVSLAPHDLASLSVSRATEENALSVSLIPHVPTTLTAPLPNNDAIFEVPLAPRSLASLDVPEALLTVDVIAAIAQASPNEFTYVALAPMPLTETAGSSRILGFGATLTADVTATAPEMPDDLLDQMAAADSNFVVREGEGDAVDTMMMSSDVLFSFGKASLSPEAEATLTTMLDMLTSVSTVEVFGHTDAIGSEANNLALGQRRAEAVRGWLLENSSFAPEQIIATGIGETDPYVPNVTANGQDDPVGRAQNRRVEFAFQ